MRGLPFFKPKNKPQFAGMNFSDASGGGGGGGGSLPDYSNTPVKVGTIGGNDLFCVMITQNNFRPNTQTYIPAEALVNKTLVDYSLSIRNGARVYKQGALYGGSTSTYVASEYIGGQDGFLVYSNNGNVSGIVTIFAYFTD